MSTIAIQELDRAVERLESHGELSPAQRQAVQACAEGIVARFLTRFTYRIDEVDEQEVERLFDLENK